MPTRQIRTGLLVLFLAAAATAHTQSFRFAVKRAADDFDIRTDAGHITCLYRVSAKKAQPSVFRKVFLDSELRPIDSVDYTIPGFATLIANDANEKYTTHVFFVKSKPLQALYFLVTEKSGAVHATFNRLAEHFSPYFGTVVKKAKYLRLDFAYNEGNPEMMIFAPRLLNGRMPVGKTTAWSVEDGHPIWTLEGGPLARTLVTDREIVGLSSTLISPYDPPNYTIHFFNKGDGTSIHSEPIHPGGGSREIAVFTSNGKEVMVAGMEYASHRTKDGHLFSSLYNMEGNKIYDRVDTTERLSTKRIHMLGSAFDNEGSLFMIAEGWKVDYTAAVLTGIATAILSGGSYISSASPDYKITELHMVKLSPTDGTILNRYAFKVGPWSEFSTLTTDNSHVLIRNGRRLLFYNPNEPTLTPGRFNSMGLNENIFITPTGPVSIYQSMRAVTLTLLTEEPAKEKQ